MRRRLLFGLGVAVLLLVGQTAWAQPDGLVAYWPFDEGSGTTAFDWSGNGNDGVLEGGARWVAEGRLGGAIEFDGSTGLVRAPFIPFNEQSFTIAMWVNPDLVSSEQVIFSQRQEGGSAENRRMHFRLYGSGHVRMGFYTNDLDTQKTIESGTWHHLTFLYKFESRTRSIYIDGMLAAEQAFVNPYLGNSGDTVMGAFTHEEYFQGIIDDVQVYDRPLTDLEIVNIMSGLVTPAQASSPSPRNQDIDVPRDLVLTWDPGDSAVKHDVYLGASFDDVNDATAGGDLMIAQGLTDASLDPGRLEFDRTYFWRVDEVNPPDNFVVKGQIWSFTVEPYSRPITDVTATASGSVDESWPEKTVDGSGLTDDLHGVDPIDMWISDGIPATITYAFDQFYKLHEMWVWNSNQRIETFMGFGAKDVVVEHSLDGENWTVLDGFGPLAKAPGREDYAHNSVIDFGLASAQQVRLTINSIHDIAPQASLSEVRFFSIPTFARLPEPADGAQGLNPGAILAWCVGRQAEQHRISLGEAMDNLALVDTVNKNNYDLGGLDLKLGRTYFWKVDEVNEAEIPGVWEGDVWSFSTADYLVVEDFEDYDIGDDEIWWTWKDGLGYVAHDNEPDYPGNGSGSAVGNENSPSYMEETIIHSGGKSLPFYYGLGNASDSWVTRTYEHAQDWTRSGVKIFVLYFHGDTDNTGGTLYVEINNKRIDYPGDASDLTEHVWTQWAIDLASEITNPQSVETMAIGVEGVGSSGVLYIDDIRLYEEAPATTSQ